MRYLPNIQARNFVQKKTNHIIFLAEKEDYQAFTNPHLFQIMSGLENYFSEAGYTFSIKFIPKDFSASLLINEAIHQKTADGVVIYGSVASFELTNMLVNESFPYIIIGKPSFQTKANWIDTNNYLSGQLCGDYLLDRGYKRIAFVSGMRMDNISRQRLHGFYQSMRIRNMNISKSYIKYGAPTKENGFILSSELLDLEIPPEVIICTNNFVAMGVQKAITDRQLRVPDEINFVTFDKYPLAYIMDPRPVIIDIDVYDLGLQAARLLLQRLRSPSLQIQTHSTIPSIIDNDQ